MPSLQNHPGSKSEALTFRVKADWYRYPGYILKSPFVPFDAFCTFM